MSHKKEPTYFCMQQILMWFSLLDLGMNDGHKGVNFAHLAQLMLLHYFVKIENLVLTTKQPSNALNYADSFIKCLEESHIWTFISQHVLKVPATDTYTVHMILDSPIISYSQCQQWGRSVQSNAKFAFSVFVGHRSVFCTRFAVWQPNFCNLLGWGLGCLMASDLERWNLASYGLTVRLSLEPSVLEHCPAGTWMCHFTFP